MDDRNGDRPRDGGREGGRDGGRDGGQRGGRPAGPPESSWLQLEVSRVMLGRADAMTTAAAEDILREAVKARVRERLGPQLEAIARIAADRFVDDIEANFEIEAKITARRAARQGAERLVDEVLGRHHGEDSPAQPGGDTPPAEPTAEGGEPRRS